jgi:predicted enzyme related to lactoylglutathione lyase
VNSAGPARTAKGRPSPRSKGNEPLTLQPPLRKENVVAVRGIDAVYYIVKNLETTQLFYSGLLGEPSVGHPGVFAEWTLADGTSFGLYCSEKVEVGASGTIMFAVDDIAASMNQAKKLGATFPSEEFTETPLCNMLLAQDPEGNEFMFHKRKAEPYFGAS